MRRGIEIRTAFAPTRMSKTYLRAAYERVSPVVQRTVVAPTTPEIAEDRNRNVVRRRQGGKQ
jgi:hypothetical protein